MALSAGGAPRFLPQNGEANATDAPTWDARFGTPGVQDGINEGSVNAVAIEGSNIFVGGTFAYAGNFPMHDVAWWNGGGWLQLSGGISGAPSGESPEIDALATSGSTLYVGGIFTSVLNGTTKLAADDVAAFDISTKTWHSLGGGVGAGAVCGFCVVRVQALLIDGSDVYAGGAFGRAGTSAADAIAVWNGSSWSSLGPGLYSCPECSPVQGGDVEDLLFLNGLVYAGGVFTNAGSLVVNNIAAWNTVSDGWQSLGGGVAAGFEGGVFALVANGEDVYAGGDFTKAGSVSVNSIAEWTGSTWQGIEGAGSGVRKSSQEGIVQALAVHDGSLFAGGSFNRLMPGSVPAEGGLASLGLSSSVWTALPMEGDTATVNVLQPTSGTGVYVGGSFATGGPIATAILLDGVGLLTGTTWSTFGQGLTYGENGRGFGLALAHGSGSEYVGGWFDQLGSAKTTGIARWDGKAWHTMGAGVAGGSTSEGPFVYAIAVDGTQVFIGGDFSSVSGVVAKNIAVWNGTKWAAVGGGTTGAVQALALNGGYLYAGGSISKAGGRSTGAPIARWKMTSPLTSTAGWSPLGPLFAAGGIVTMAFFGKYLMVGGDLSFCGPGSPCDNGSSEGTTPCETASGWDVNGLMLWDSATPGKWYYPFGCGVTLGVGDSQPGEVTSLLLDGQTLYVGGSFDHAGIPGVSANSLVANNIASLSLSALSVAKSKWSALGTGAGNDADGNIVNSLARAGGLLYAGGEFVKAGGVPAVSLAQWNITTSKWSAVDGSLGCSAYDCTSTYANAVDSSAAGVYVTGNFSAAGGKASGNLGLYQPGTG
jgi:hypothetical protein